MLLRYVRTNWRHHNKDCPFLLSSYPLSLDLSLYNLTDSYRKTTSHTGDRSLTVIRYLQPIYVDICIFHVTPVKFIIPSRFNRLWPRVLRIHLFRSPSCHTYIRQGQTIKERNKEDTDTDLWKFVRLSWTYRYLLCAATIKDLLLYLPEQDINQKM